jgi:hypothetical protein
MDEFVDKKGKEIKEDYLLTGVDTLQIIKFCSRFKLPMYALDDDEKTFKTYHPETRNKKAPIMMFRVSNNHFYPIPESEKKSILKITSLINSSSDLIVVQNESEVIKTPIDNVVVLEDTNAMVELGKYINETKIIPSNLKMTNKKITSFNIQKTQYAINQNIELTRQIALNMEIPYEGQSLGNLIGKIIENTIKHLPKSSHNPNVFKSLLVAKKSRAFGGLIEDNCVSLIKEPYQITYQKYQKFISKKCFKFIKQNIQTNIKNKMKLYLKNIQSLKPDYSSLINHPNTIARDITKCYTSVMYNPVEDWIKLDFNDCWVECDDVNDIKLGLYKVETEDTLLFKKSDVYSSAIINKAIKEGIDFKITHKLVSKGKEDKSLFVEVINKIVEYSKGDKGLYKLLINSMSGLLGRSKTSVSNCNINKDIEQIFNAINTYEGLGKSVFINKIPETDYFLYGTDNEIMLSETNLPMYIQVLDQSNIKVYDMIKE